ncbi:TetR/AcrR family transcriptional regulator [Planomonospora venezuelensis]|uniref:AcrR family transcriptional regulator n=1 Tax=Planomonospora venezuelensis TaxID=1999 RepID=A0A841D4T7_PLAVE|nr:TetR/AcrR family transcriptional regulator [Planomonospora venezuelensis]MBB5964479.1 AcrR family transcriptional regulator [Planomonospora venezuelensis]GIN04214.1 TetR family transcriptional regulator [Planomonospora venezuelensis]
MNAGRTARERVRAELTREITDIARRQLAVDGAAGLSLRAVAREMGMVSSAIYRYFPSRDDLLTALIIDGYNTAGEAVERADAACPRSDYTGRWLAVCHAVRDWALARPHEYALLYGSPVPGYQAPMDTVTAAVRDTVVYGRILSEAHAAGALNPPGVCPPAPASFAGDAARVREVMPGVPDDVVARALVAWSGLFGWVSFELFGQFNAVVLDPATAFGHAMRCHAALLGLPAPAAPPHR